MKVIYLLYNSINNVTYKTLIKIHWPSNLRKKYEEIAINADLNKKL